MAAFSTGTSALERLAGDHEAADVLRQVAREADQLAHQPHQQLQPRGLDAELVGGESALYLARLIPPHVQPRQAVDIARRRRRARAPTSRTALRVR